MTGEEQLAQAERLLASPEPFRTWLEGLASINADCGNAGTGDHCPIHDFLFCHGLRLWVGGTSLYSENTPRPLPAWAASLVEAIDSQYGVWQRIPAWSARMILDQLSGEL